MLLVHVSGRESAFFTPQWSETINQDPKTIAFRRLLVAALPQNLTLHDDTSPMTPSLAAERFGLTVVNAKVLHGDAQSDREARVTERPGGFSSEY
jgi:hypothetical protein